jgi:hypothetical protein
MTVKDMTSDKWTTLEAAVEKAKALATETNVPHGIVISSDGKGVCAVRNPDAWASYYPACVSDRDVRIMTCDAETGEPRY